MSKITKPLSASEEAYVAMVLEEHATAIRAADQKRDERMKPLLAEKGIPEGFPVKIEKLDPKKPAVLAYHPPAVAQSLKSKRRS